MHHISDEELMERFRRGELKAFQELYNRYEKRLYAFFVKNLSDKEKANDLFQECFLRVIKNCQSFSPEEGRFSAWVFTIAYNLVRDVYRSKKQQQTIFDWTENEPEVMHLAAPENPILHILEKEQQALMRQALERLPESQREVILLSKYANLSFKEIGKIIGCSEKAAKQMAYRAIQNLRLLFNQQRGQNR